MFSAIGMSACVVILRFVFRIRRRWRPARSADSHHHAGIVGWMEVGIGGGKLVGFGDGTETEGLRGLRAECVRTIRHGAHHLALSKIFGQ